MSILKISQHSDVPAALDLVKEEVEKATMRIVDRLNELIAVRDKQKK